MNCRLQEPTTISFTHTCDRLFLGVLIAILAAPACQAQFQHPGISHSQNNLNFIKNKITQGQQPWATAWKSVKESSHASLDYQPNPFSKVERGPYNDPDIGSSEFSSDAKAAYVHAICWVLSEDKAHAEKSAEILNGWSSTLQSVSNHDARLLIGMGGYDFCNAAEIIRHTWNDWPADKQSDFERMLKTVFYPPIKDFYPSANGNWDASMLRTMIAMGVFLDDQAMFDRAVDYFQNGKGNGAVRNYFKPSGQCQESGRDQAHTQMGLNFLACTCEIAWHQGVDLYSAYDSRLLKGYEYTARYNLGFDVPYEPYRSFEGRYHYKSISDDTRGRLQPIYEKVLNHYQNRKGLKAEFTVKAVTQLRTSWQVDGDDHRESRNRNSRGRRSSRRQSAAFDTLLFAEQDSSTTQKQTP